MTAALKPPSRLYDLAEAEAAFEAFIPDLVGEMSSILGRRVPALGRRQREAVRRRLRRLIYDLRPSLIALHALQGKLDRAQAEYALGEHIMRLQLQACRVRVPRHRDAFDFWREVATKAAHVSPALKDITPYRSTRTLLYRLSLDLARSEHHQRLQTTSEEWVLSEDARRTLAFLRRFPNYYRRFVRKEPRRFADGTIARLSDEYKTCAPFFEMRLRLLLAMDAAAKGAPGPWTEWQTTALPALLDAAEHHPHLCPLAAVVNRNVRNALAHGESEWNPNLRQVRFHDRRVSVIWSPRDFFVRTRTLMWTCRALADFEALMNAVRARVVVAQVWKRTQKPAVAPATPA